MKRFGLSPAESLPAGRQAPKAERQSRYSTGETGEGERVFPFSLARMSAQDTSLPAGRQGPPVGRIEKGNRKNKTGFPALFYFC